MLQGDVVTMSHGDRHHHRLDVINADRLEELLAQALKALVLSPLLRVAPRHPKAHFAALMDCQGRA